eukprot:TRINITY_DN4126_c0_g1_i1.p1 TRINITY_DN4126_c0_g1~~TRINITY_DN4126_c0_g1_i1.p1  ORF type:complete len:520 (-),score=79.38 TRINITY_DN4126_c0_g1_i1:107-1666(-)
MDYRNDPPQIPERFVKFGPYTEGQKKVRDTRSNHVLFFHDVSNSDVVFQQNQKFKKLYITDSHDAHFQILDSCVIGTRSCILMNCVRCTVLWDEVDIRNLYFYNCRECTLQFCDSETLIENFKIFWIDCENNIVQRVIVKPGTDPNQVTAVPVVVKKSFNLALGDGTRLSEFTDGKTLVTNVIPVETVLSLTEVESQIRVHEDNNQVFDHISNSQLGALYKQELEEFSEPDEVLINKVKLVASALLKSKHAVIYTGAGISTNAKLSDYRGPRGTWTVLDFGGSFNPDNVQLGQAFPTYSHYAIAELVKRGLVKFVTSTNLDGLHRRSGIPKEKISELHGNCYREVCDTCSMEYLRGFNTLETREDRWTHLTGRLCSCGGKLKDTIVHFTENIHESEWSSAVLHSRASDLALVLGTSMNVQPAASLPDKCLKNEGKFFIVNLQRTPYDEFSTLKIYCDTDRFMELLMKEIGIPEFDQDFDLVRVLNRKERKKNQDKFFLPAIGVIVLVGIVAAFAFRYRR